MIFSVFQKKLGMGVFLVHPTVVLVLLSALVERCFVSRMRDFNRGLADAGSGGGGSTMGYDTLQIKSPKSLTLLVLVQLG